MWARRGRPGTCSTRDGPGVVGELCFAAGAIVLGRSRVITNVGHTLTYAGIERPTVDVDVHTTVGLDLTALPWLDFAVEIAFCVGCWILDVLPGKSEAARRDPGAEHRQPAADAGR